MSSSTGLTVSVNNLPSLDFASSLDKPISSLRSVESLGGFELTSDGAFGYQGFYLSGIYVHAVIAICCACRVDDLFHVNGLSLTTITRLLFLPAN